MMWDDVWGWIAPFVLFITDNLTACGAFVLFILQAVYQMYRIRIQRIELTKQKDAREKTR
jgi:hypothetical protein